MYERVSVPLLLLSYLITPLATVLTCILLRFQLLVQKHIYSEKVFLFLVALVPCSSCLNVVLKTVAVQSDVFYK